MSPRVTRPPARTDEPFRLSPDPGTFRPDGSWDHTASERSPAYRFVAELVRHKSRAASPADIAVLVAGSPFPDILGPALLEWSRCRHAELWSTVHAPTSAAATVKRFRSVYAVEPIPIDCDCDDCRHYAEMRDKIDAYAARLLA